MERLTPLSDGAPLYRRVKEQLVREIGQGRYPVTDPLPSEQKLAARESTQDVEEPASSIAHLRQQMLDAVANEVHTG